MATIIQNSDSPKGMGDMAAAVEAVNKLQIGQRFKVSGSNQVYSYDAVTVAGAKFMANLFFNGQIQLL